MDGMTVEDLPGYLKKHWPTIRGQRLDGSYRPSPVLRLEAVGQTRLQGAAPPWCIV